MNVLLAGRTVGGLNISKVEIWNPITVSFARGHFDHVAEEDLANADRLFQRAQELNPDLFDGPIVLSCDLRERSSALIEVVWATATYRRLALRRLGYRVSSLFVTVLVPTLRAEVLIVRSAQRTAGAGRWQLPGGSVEPPTRGERITMAHLASEASRELFEETAIKRSSGDLEPWILSRGENGNIGVGFLASPADAHEIHAASEHVRHGGGSELDDLRTVGDLQQIANIDGVDYLKPYVHRYRQRHGA